MSLYKQRKSQFWWCEFKIRGQKIRQSTGTANRRQAEVEERRLRTQAEMSNPGTGKLDFEYLTNLDADRALSEGADLRRGETILGLWRPLAKFFEADDEITTHRLREYVVYRRTECSVRGQTIRRELQALRRGLRLAEYHCPAEWPRIKKDPPKQSLRGKLHPPDKIKEWLGQLTGEAKDEAVFAMYTGLRATEIKRIHSGMIEVSPPGVNTPAVLRIPAEATKTKQERVIGLSQEALEILQRRKRFSSENHRKQREAASGRVGLSPGVSLRDLRHFFATIALQHTGDAAAVMAALGHTDLRTTQIYQSSTIARTATASSAVSKALGLEAQKQPGVLIPSTHTAEADLAKCPELWRAIQGSNLWPSAPEAISSMLATISRCFYWLALVKERLEMQQNALDDPYQVPIPENKKVA